MNAQGEDMNIQQPTVIYRGFDLPSVRRLASFLKNSGIDAKVAIPDPHCARSIPIAETLHELLAINFEPERVRALILEWDSSAGTQSSKSDTQSGLYCYHCGESIASATNICPFCNETLEFEPSPFGPEGR